MAEREVVPFVVYIAPCANTTVLFLITLPVLLKLLDVGQFIDIAREVVWVLHHLLFWFLIDCSLVLLVVGLLKLGEYDVGKDGILDFGRRDPVEEKGVVSLGGERLTGFRDNAMDSDHTTSVVVREIKTCPCTQCFRNLDE
jgi:hypothetical protein